MMADKSLKIPGPGHPITITPAKGPVVVRLTGRVTAETHNALVLQEASYPPVFYVPRQNAAAWSYETPYPAMAAIKDHLAFYPDRVDAIET
jgi:uncharacterized protein (DUF427 family)